MAAVVHALWERQDAGPLILPASVPIDEPVVKSGSTRYREDNWTAMIGMDVDGSNSLPLSLDRENANLGRYSACRRVARTIYLGSAPLPRNPNRGLTEGQIKLGCVQPGENIAIFGDALRRLSDQSTHLYVDNQRYWYSTQTNVTRLALDRAAQYDDDALYEEIEKRLKAEQTARGDFARVHAYPASGSDIADDDLSVRLVILKPYLTHALRDQDSKAREAANEILNLRVTTPRHYRNTLVFLAADRNRLEDLKQGVRQFLAWDSIQSESEKETLNMDTYQRNQARTKREETHKIVEARIPETYTWLLVPDQPDPKRPDELQELRLQPNSPLAVNAGRKLKSEDMLITQYAGTLRRHEMDRIPLWRGNYVHIKELAENFATYVYLPRLKNTDVLLAAIREGVQSMWWERETFAYADSYDDERNRYLGLKAGQEVQVTLNASSVLVKPEAAAAQIAADTQAAAARIEAAKNYAAQSAKPAPVVSERAG